MTFDEIITKVREEANERLDCGNVKFLAIQVKLTGVNGGIFYVEIKDGKANVEPYEYKDRSCVVIMEPINFLKLIDGKLNPVMAYTEGKLKVEGDLAKALEFSKHLTCNSPC